MSSPELGWRLVDAPHPQPADHDQHDHTGPPLPSAIEALTATLLEQQGPDA